jgi:hypothetical protein
VENGTDDLPATDGIRPAVTVALEHDCRAVICLDDGAKVRPKRPVAAPSWIVSPPEATSDLAFAPSLCDIEMLFPAIAEAYLPSLWIGEADPVKRFEPHGTTVSNSRGSHKSPHPAVGMRL